MFKIVLRTRLFPQPRHSLLAPPVNSVSAVPSLCGAWLAVAAVAVAADLVVSGVGVTLLDTAGMRSSSDLVEQLGVERSAAAAAAADVVVMVVDAEQGWTDGDGEIFDSLWGKEGPGSRSCKVRGPALLVANKQDLAGWSVGGWVGGWH